MTHTLMWSSLEKDHGFIIISGIECDHLFVGRTPNIPNKDQVADKKPKNDKSPISLKHEFDPTGEV